MDSEIFDENFFSEISMEISTDSEISADSEISVDRDEKAYYLEPTRV